MALIKCPECGNEISDKALKCTNCGYPISEPEEKFSEPEPQYIPPSSLQSKSSNKKLFILIPAVLLVLVIISLITSGKSQEEIDAEYTAKIYGPWDYYQQISAEEFAEIYGGTEKTGGISMSMSVIGTTTYLPTSRYISGFDFTMNYIKNNKITEKVILSFVLNGTWEIKGGKIIEKVDKSTFAPVNKESQEFLDSYPDFVKSFTERENTTDETKIIKFEKDKFIAELNFENGKLIKESTFIKSDVSYPEIRTGKLRIKTVDGIWFDYEGRSRYNLPDGFGKAWYDNGDYYEGNFKDGNRHGNGKYTFKSGGYYSGTWSNNKRNGTGTEVFANGNKYEGNFLNNKRDGFGTFTWNNGSKYVGMWKNDKQNGKGRYYNKLGLLTSSGTWINGKFYK